ncbi:hypothetical protein HK097_011682 [Rhizophlyctis rosea]|uniref:Uncharacterized protein n=1 Tax=Rhizophlyctis rosea TaxID=64517 RepID=A0AAD5WZ31_9FUNG|nr:hypothetical protein HK097_011682 [Rhizophlyctis rosea]
MSTTNPPRLLPTNGKYPNEAVLSLLPKLDPCTITIQQAHDLLQWYIDPNYPCSQHTIVPSFLAKVPISSFLPALTLHLSQPPDYFTHHMAISILLKRHHDYLQITKEIKQRLLEIGAVDNELAAREGDLPFGFAHFIAIELLYNIAATRDDIERADSLTRGLKQSCEVLPMAYGEEIGPLWEASTWARSQWYEKVASAVLMMYIWRKVVKRKVPLEVGSQFGFWTFPELGWGLTQWRRFVEGDGWAPVVKEGGEWEKYFMWKLKMRKTWQGHLGWEGAEKWVVYVESVGNFT